MVLNAYVQVPMTAGDEAFLPPLSPEMIAARTAKRDYIVCLGVAMITPVLMMLVASLIH